MPTVAGMLAKREQKQAGSTWRAYASLGLAAESQVGVSQALP